MNKEFQFTQHGCCTNPNTHHITYLLGNATVVVWTAEHKGRWYSGFESKIEGRKIWRPCAIGYPGFKAERTAKYHAFQGLIDLFEFYLDLLYRFEWEFDEDDDPAPVLEEWFIENIKKLKIEQGYYDEDVIFNIDNEYGIE